MGKRQATGRSGTNRDGVIAVFVDWFFGSRRCILVFFVRGAGRIVFIFYFRKVEVFDSRAHATECSILGQREIVDTNRNCFVFGDAWNMCARVLRSRDVYGVFPGGGAFVFVVRWGRDTSKGLWAISFFITGS